jgi:hypothetical protein
MMRMNSKAALGMSALLSVALVAACSDSATAPTAASVRLPKVGFLVAGDAATSTPVPGEFRVCKAGNTSGSFVVSATAPDGTTQGGTHSVVSSPITIPAGSCVVVAADNGGSGFGSNVTVEESPATNLTSVVGARISITDGTTTINNPSNPYTDFINSIHGVRLTFTNSAVSSGCTFTQGYYKNHETYVSNLLNGGTINIGTLASPFLLNADQIDANLGTNPKGGNAFYILSHQLITAELNIIGGASAPQAVQDAIDDAQELFADGAISAGERASAISLAAILDAYNNGLAAGGPAHCD